MYGLTTGNWAGETLATAAKGAAFEEGRFHRGDRRS